VSEARKQAEITARHVEIADQSQKQGQRQVTLAEATKAQAEETARQGKTVMLFTVVTIIFVREPVLVEEATQLTTIAATVIYGSILRHQCGFIPFQRQWKASNQICAQIHA